MEQTSTLQNIPVHCAYDEIIPISKAKPNPMNPNQHPQRQINMLAEFIRQQGWRAPITISTRSGYIVRGHGRLMAAQLLGLETVPADYQDYDSDASEMADMIADNKIAELSDLDDEIIASILAEIRDSDFDAELTGYELDEINKILEEEPAFTPADTSPAYTASETYEIYHDRPSPSEYNSEYIEQDIQKKQDQTGEIDLSDYAEERYTHECPKCKFKW